MTGQHERFVWQGREQPPVDRRKDEGKIPKLGLGVAGATREQRVPAEHYGRALN
jgi:hypothetical protein